MSSTEVKPARPPRTKVLVVAHPDGFLEIFGDRTVDARVVNLLDVTDLEYDLAEEYLDATLPKPYRELHYPNKLRAIGQCRKVSAEQELDRVVNVELVRGLRQLADEPRLVPMEKCA